MNYYKEKVQQYFTNARFDLISLLPNTNNSKVLEVGAGGGDTLVAIKDLKLASEVTGIELFDLPDTNQKNQNIDSFIIGDIENPHFSLPEDHFDFIICGDVIEHLVDPWKAIEFLSRSLKPGGQFIASIPNIRFYQGLIKIYIKGDFGYEEKGLFDKTHMRFFCIKNMVTLFDKKQFVVDKLLPINFFSDNRGIFYYFSKLTFGLFDQFVNIQYVIVATKRK